MVVHVDLLSCAGEQRDEEEERAERAHGALGVHSEDFTPRCVVAPHAPPCGCCAAPNPPNPPNAIATAPASDEVRERRGLLRAFYSFVHSLVHSELTAVLSAPENAAHISAGPLMVHCAAVAGTPSDRDRFPLRGMGAQPVHSACLGVVRRNVRNGPHTSRRLGSTQ